MAALERSSSFGLFFKQLRALLWKSLIIRKVHFVSTFFELCGPLLLIIALAYINSIASNLGDNTGPVEEFIGPLTYNKDGPFLQIEYDLKTDFQQANHFQVLYAPEDDVTGELMKRFNDPTKVINLRSFKTESALDFELAKDMNDNQYNHNHSHPRANYDNTIAIFFVNSLDSVKTGSLSYKIKLPGRAEIMQITQERFPLKFDQAPYIKSSSQYERPLSIKMYEHFTTISAYINRAFIEHLCLTTGSKQSCAAKFKPIKIELMPYPKYKNPKTTGFSIQDLLGLAIPISYVLLVPLIVKRITDEKSTKAKELLRLIGMSDFVFWFSHFLNYFILVIIHAILFSILLFVFHNPVFSLSSPIVFGIGITLFGAQMIMFSMLITTVFTRPVIATIVTVILWIVAAAVIFYNLVPSIHPSINIPATNGARFGTSFLPSGSIIWLCSIMGTLEANNIGLGFSNLNTPTRLYGDLTAFYVMLIMFCSLFVYVFFIWYLDNVWPFQHGVPKSPIFLFKPSFWFPHEKNDDDSHAHKNGHSNIDPKTFETEPKDLNASIRVHNLVKVFNKIGEGKKKAVDHLSLNIYANQITVLLGHNGAGKTTTMNMITGMFGSTSGTIYVNGFNVFTQTKQARRSIGLCPQENIIFNELTVAQHLRLFAMLKDYPTSKIEYEVTNILDLLKLMDKKNVLATKLSGGMKRKLSLGIALVGDTETLILDEPTSGMDPDARRVIWDLLMNIRRSRTILLTTHYMEEADVLGDRIAIMNEGKLTCSGSPFFLKTAFGTGYRLRIAKQPQFNSTKFQSNLRRYIPSATLNTEIETEVVYCLDDGQMDKQAVIAVLPEMFDDIEKNKQKYCIDSCGLSYATLEDVFLKVGSDLDLNQSPDEQNHSNGNGHADHSYSNGKVLLTSPADLHSGPALIFQQFLGLFLKRFHFARRYWPMIIFQIGIPTLVIILAMLVQKAGKSISNIKTARLDLDVKKLYGPNTETFYYGEAEYAKSYEAINNAKYGAFVSQLNNITTDSQINNWVLQRVNNDLNTYIQKYLYGLGIDGNFIKTWINGEQYHSLPLAVNVLFETMLRTLVPQYADSGSFIVESAPMLAQSDTQALELVGAIFSWALTCLIFLPIAFPFLAASYILYPIKEHASKAKLIQLMTGLSPVTFWIANFIFDLINHVIAISILYLVIYLFDSDNVFFGGHHGSSSAIILYLLLIAFGVSVIPMVYFLSYFFAKPSSGFVFLIIIFFLIGFIGNIVFSILDLLINYLHMEILEFWYPFLLIFLRVVPIFSMLFGYQKVQKLTVFTNICTTMTGGRLDETCAIMENLSPKLLKENPLRGCCPKLCDDMCYMDENPFSFRKSGAGIEVTYMLVCGLICFLLIVLNEAFKQQFAKFFSFFSFSRLIPSKSKKQQQNGIQNGHIPDNAIPLVSMDSDVEMERIRIEDEVRRHRGKQTDLLTVSRLTKTFDQFTAVDELSFGVHYNECFGLLGVNGAGKTTTFSMLTGDLLPSGGNAYIQKGQFELIESMRHFQRNIGYCPQFDALLDKLTGEETLYLFGRLRGIPADSLARDIRNLIKMIGLEKHAGKRTDTYSGGNRRKLSIAIALIGNPPILFLDEPSAGVDPAARRKLWQTLGYLKRNFNSSIVLTSHSMEECEALCSRIGIMVNGRFRCLGSTQHLRSKYGQGYSVTISLRKQHESDQTYVNEVQAEMAKAIPSSVLKDYHQALMHYHVTDPNERWSNLFRQMSLLNDRFHFEDYFVSDTTLEQIFIMFARHQK